MIKTLSIDYLPKHPGKINSLKTNIKKKCSSLNIKTKPLSIPGRPRTLAGTEGTAPRTSSSRS